MKSRREAGPAVQVRTFTYGQLESIMDARRGLTTPAGSGNSSYENGPSRAWDDKVGYDGAREMLARGWDAGNTAIADVLSVPGADMAPTGGWDLDVAGAFPDVACYVSGDPECMYHPEEGPAPRRVRLVLSTSYSGSITAQSAMEYARAGAAYAATMMARGLDVAITGLEVVGCGSEGTVVLAISVKEYGQDPDGSRIAFVMHPAFLRRTMFAAAESDGTLPVTMRNYGYGTPAYDTTRAREYCVAAFPDSADERVVALPPLESNDVSTAEYLRRWAAMALDAAIDDRDSNDQDRQWGAK